MAQITRNKNKPKRILVICQHFWPENFRINDICDYFVEKNCEIDVLCGIPNYPKGKIFEGYGLFKKRRELHNKINIERTLEIPRGNNSNLKIFLNYISYPVFSLFHIPRLLTREYDIIFIYQFSPVYMAIPGIIIGKLNKIETTMYILDLWPENLYSVLNIKNKFLKKIIGSTSHWHYKKVDKIIVLSEKMKDIIMRIRKISEKNILILPQNCEKIYEKDVDDILLRKKFPAGFNMVFAGNISPAQDFETVIAAAKKLRGEGINDINWIIVGDGMSRQWLEEEVKKSTLESNFFFEGSKPMEEIPKYHTIADGLLACLVESDLLDATIPSKVMSYFAAGRPMILAMNGEAQRIVNQVGCGFAGPSSDAETLYRNIKKLYLLSHKERIKMGKKGRDYHFVHFERNLILDKLYRFLFN